MKELTILLSWHKETDHEKISAYETNKNTFIAMNPGIDVITVINPIEDEKKAWLCPDLALFNWYAENGEQSNSKRFLFVEWDSWCDCSMEEYFDKVWDCDVVSSSVKYYERDDWYWFRTIDQLPSEARIFATGVVPFCGTFVSDFAMSVICEEILKPEYEEVISELRLGTIATMLNLDPVVNPVCNRSLNWREIGPLGIRHKGIHHPRKSISEIRPV